MMKHAIWKSGRWKQMIRPLTMLVIMLMLFTYVSFSWMRREWTPTIEQNGITIATSGSLVFQMDDNSGPSDGKTINEILGIDDFALIPVSNLTGETDHFFKLDANSGPGQETYVHLDKSSPEYGDKAQTMGIKNGYLEFRFQLYAPDGPDTVRYIYLHETKVETAYSLTGNVDVASCLRVSVTAEHTGQTWLFVPADGVTHTGVTTEMVGGRYVADGVRFYKTYDTITETGQKTETVTVNNQNYNILETNPQIHRFEEFNGYTNDAYDSNKALFAMNAGDDSARVWITVRIWIEGTDENCTDSISDGQINLLLRFGSFTNKDLTS